MKEMRINKMTRTEVFNKLKSILPSKGIIDRPEEPWLANFYFGKLVINLAPKELEMVKLGFKFTIKYSLIESIELIDLGYIISESILKIKECEGSWVKLYSGSNDIEIWYSDNKSLKYL